MPCSRPLAEGRGEGIVDDRIDAPLAALVRLRRDLSDGAQVHQVQGRIDRRLEVQSARTGVHGPSHGLGVGEVHATDLDAELRVPVGEQGMSAAVQQSVRDDLVAGLEQATERGRHRGHPGGECQAGVGPFHRRQLAFQEAAGRLLEAVVDVDGRAVQLLAEFPELVEAARRALDGLQAEGRRRRQRRHHMVGIVPARRLGRAMHDAGGFLVSVDALSHGRSPIISRGRSADDRRQPCRKKRAAQSRPSCDSS